MKTSLLYITFLLIIIISLSNCGRDESKNPEREMPETRFEFHTADTDRQNEKETLSIETADILGMNDEKDLLSL